MWGGIHSTLLQPVTPSGEAEQQAVITAQYGVNFLFILHVWLLNKTNMLPQALIKVTVSSSLPAQSLAVSEIINSVSEENI
jgi:hypothetical protein